MSDTPRTDAVAHNIAELGVFSRQLERELTAAQAEIARLKAGGCARYQRTTQFCAEALTLQERIETLENEKMELQKQHQQFGDNAFENALALVNHRDQLQEENTKLHERVKNLITLGNNMADYYGDVAFTDEDDKRIEDWRQAAEECK